MPENRLIARLFANAAPAVFPALSQRKIFFEKFMKTAGKTVDKRQEKNYNNRRWFTFGKLLV